MGMTVSNQASYLYSLYQYESSTAAQSSSVDLSAVSKQQYNISSLSNAVDALNGVSSQNGYSIGSASSAAAGLIQESQLSGYATIKDNLKSSVQTEIFSGNADLSSLYSTLGFNPVSTRDYLKILSGGYASSGSSGNAVNDYKSYLSSSTETSLLNFLA